MKEGGLGETLKDKALGASVTWKSTTSEEKINIWNYKGNLLQ